MVSPVQELLISPREGWKDGWMEGCYRYGRVRTRECCPVQMQSIPCKGAAVLHPRSSTATKRQINAQTKKHPLERATSVSCSKAGKTLTLTWLVTVWQLGKLNGSMDFRNSRGASWIKDVDLLAQLTLQALLTAALSLDKVPVLPQKQLLEPRSSAGLGKREAPWQAPNSDCWEPKTTCPKC